MKYRGTYVIERQKGDDWEVLFSVSDEVSAPTAADAHGPLLDKVSTSINEHSPMLTTAEDDPEPLPTEAVPNAPTIKSVNNDRE